MNKQLVGWVCFYVALVVFVVATYLSQNLEMALFVLGLELCAVSMILLEEGGGGGDE